MDHKADIRYAILTVIFAISLCNCSKSDNTGWRNDFAESDFEHIELDLSKGEPMDFINDSLGRPNKMKMLDNNYLAISDAKINKMLWLADIENKKAKNLITLGNGPEELLDLSAISYSNGILSLSGCQDSKVLDFKVCYDSLNITPVNHLVLPYSMPLRSIVLETILLCQWRARLLETGIICITGMIQPMKISENFHWTVSQSE